MKQLNRFSDQVAIITGGSAGLGASLAERLAVEGAHVVVFDNRPAARDEVIFHQVDVTSPFEVKQAVDKVTATFGRLDILVNCAGVVGKTNIKSHLIDLEVFDHVMRVNLRGSLITFQAAIPHMLERGYGRVLHVASIAGKEGNAGMLAYSTSKAAVIGMTKVQGKDYAETGVTINALAPAVVRTPIIDAIPEAQVKYMTDKIPMKRCGTLDEFAAMAAFIISPDAGFTTGFTFDLTGGRATY